jgi:hypothetical protein
MAVPVLVGYANVRTRASAATCGVGVAWHRASSQPVLPHALLVHVPAGPVYDVSTPHIGVAAVRDLHA